MRREATIFLQLIIVALGIVTFTALLWEPWVEGVNANATSLYDIYFDDPFLAYVYFAFIPVFVGLYQAFKLAGNIGRGEVSSPSSKHALRTIKYCALSFAGLIMLALAYIVIIMSGEDDIAGGVAIGLFLVVTSLVIAGVTAKLEPKAKKGINAQ